MYVPNGYDPGNQTYVLVCCYVRLVIAKMFQHKKGDLSQFENFNKYQSNENLQVLILGSD